MSNFFNKDDLLSLDVTLAKIEQQYSDNDDLVRRLAEHRVSFVGDLTEILSIDPLSDDYRLKIAAVHEEIIGKHYSTSYEGLPVLSPDHERDWPYPWGTKSPETVARFLIAYGFLIKKAALPPNARVLEVGCGVGSLTWNLSRMGYRLDALDPNEVQCNIVRTATRDFPVPPNVVAMTLDQWLTVKAKHHSYKYDAVIFFESFHHISDHQECLRRIIETHLEPDGKILLGAEPVAESGCETMPYPWGPRLDGESLRAMRRWGWLELGFTEAYLKQLFDHLGLSFECARCDEALPWSQIFIGKNAAGAEPPQGDDCTSYDASLEEGISFSVAGMPKFIDSYSGLSNREAWGRWSIGDKVVFRFAKKLPRRFMLTLELADVFGPNVHKMLNVGVGAVVASHTLKEIGVQSTYQFDFDDVDSSVVEIRIPHPYRPKDIIELNNEDSRRIGIALIAMTLKHV